MAGKKKSDLTFTRIKIKLENEMEKKLKRNEPDLMLQNSTLELVVGFLLDSAV